MVMESELYNRAYNFCFNETYNMWKADLERIFAIGTTDASGGCNLSACILVLIGIESFSLFFSDHKKQKAFEEFIDTYFDKFYRGKMGKIYVLFRHGLAHNFYPKSEFKFGNPAHIPFGVDENNKVVTLKRLESNLGYFRDKTQNLDPKTNEAFKIFPQVLFLDVVQVMDDLKQKLQRDKLLQQKFIKNYRKVKKILGHKP
jgi:hypothetical protein